MRAHPPHRGRHACLLPSIPLQLLTLRRAGSALQRSARPLALATIEGDQLSSFRCSAAARQLLPTLAVGHRYCATTLREWPVLLFQNVPLGAPAATTRG